VLPHRELLIRAGVIEARARDGTTAPYNGAEMSDGERVVFYDIGQALAAPYGAIIVIDEPEIHLHRAVQARLWDAIEQERPDCFFVYITHDLEFAASRSGMAKVWVRGYNGGAWDWRVVPDDTGLPDELLLTVVGSRKPVLFCEGDRSSLDHALYSHAYETWTVIPCGSCESVIHATRTFSSLRGLHHLECQGVIDRDQRSGEESHFSRISEFMRLRSQKQRTCSSLTMWCARSDTTLPARMWNKLWAHVRSLVLENLARDRERVAADLTRAVIETQIRRMNAAGDTRENLVASVTALTATLDPGAVFDQHIAAVDSVLASNDVIAR
jgi:hypothetical protein